MERFRIEGSEGSSIVRVTHEDLELSDAEGAMVMSWTVEFPYPVQGSVALLQCEAARRVLNQLEMYVNAAEQSLGRAYPIKRPDTNGQS